MEIAMLGIAVAAVVIAILWWWRRRASAPVDDWPSSTTAEAGPLPGSAPPPQVLDRDALVNRSRVLDPSKWDNTPETAGAGDDEPPEAGDLPRFFDRDYLRRQHGD